MKRAPVNRNRRPVSSRQDNLVVLVAEAVKEAAATFAAKQPSEEDRERVAAVALRFHALSAEVKDAEQAVRLMIAANNLLKVLAKITCAEIRGELEQMIAEHPNAADMVQGLFERLAAIERNYL